MMKRSCLLLWGLTLLTVLIATGAAQNPSGTPSHYAINPEAIARVEILYFPERFETRAGFTPARLEQAYQYKIEMRGFAAIKEHKEFATALNETVFSPSHGSYDLRTAVLVYDRGGRRLLSVYFDQGGRNGVVNTQPFSRSGYVSSNFALYQWAKSILIGLDHR
jgi:hypothetical protein